MSPRNVIYVNTVALFGHFVTLEIRTSARLSASGGNHILRG
jgi:hypothetical protein